MCSFCISCLCGGNVSRVTRTSICIHASSAVRTFACALRTLTMDSRAVGDGRGVETPGSPEVASKINLTIPVVIGRWMLFFSVQTVV
jgi:hypothetical protein